MEASEPWRVLEFYSGIGGLRYSLTASGVSAEVVEAFDINDVANDVYELNFGHRPCQGNIQTLTASDLDKYKAHAWLLSPPCQPYTRQGLQKHSADARAFSFIKILNLMRNMSYPPQMLFVENVVGFEAKQEPMCFQNPSFNKKLLRTPLALSLTVNNTVNTLSSHDQDEEQLELVCKPIKEFLVKDANGGIPRETVLQDYGVPSNLIERWGNAMDIVHPESKRCCCFTKSYYRYVKGTGSLLATSENLKEIPELKLEVSSLKELGLRFFTPREVANLHSFPSNFCFPDHISLRQQYAMLGNSLSVAVVGPLLRYLFAEA